MLRVELVYMVQRSNHGRLNKIFGVGEVSGAGGEAAMREAMERLVDAGEERIQRGPVTRLDASDQIGCRFEPI